METSEPSCRSCSVSKWAQNYHPSGRDHGTPMWLAPGHKVARGWDGWMASLTQWTWVWANSGRQWRTEEPGAPQSMGSQGVGHDWGLNNNIKLSWAEPALWALLPHPHFLFLKTPGPLQNWNTDEHIFEALELIFCALQSSLRSSPL